MPTAAPTARLSDPLDLPHGPTWRDRLALAPLTNTQSHADGTLSDAERAWLVARGRGGFGQVMTAAAYVTPAGQAWGGQLGIASDAHLPGLVALAEELRATGAASAVQLHHGGRRADPALSGRPNQCPWDDPDKQAVAMTTAEVEQVVADFVAAAVRAEQAGFDGAQLHGAHGYLIGQFLDGFHVAHVNGTMSVADRADILRGFADDDCRLVTNARCLTEGVDLPAVDMVAFCSPRKSPRGSISISKGQKALIRT